MEGAKLFLEGHWSLEVYLAVHSPPSTSLGRRQSDDMAKWWFHVCGRRPLGCAIGRIGPSEGVGGLFGGSPVLRNVLGGPVSFTKLLVI